MSQGVLVCMMPPAMLLIFSIIDVNYVRPFFTTALGWMMLTVAIVFDALGLWLMFKLVKVDV
jgi:Flp pilus assembly protein TadB